MRHNPHTRLLVPALLAVSLLATSAPLRAQTADVPPETGAGPRKLIMYLGCAATVFASTSVPGAILALVSCGRIVLDEMPR